MQVINIADKFKTFQEQWRPKVIAELNGQHVRAVKLQGEFVWHKHESEDELFLVVDGRLRLHIRHDHGEESFLDLGPGEMMVMPRGVEHKPESLVETQVLLFEPAATVNTGNVKSERTVSELARI